MRPSIVASVVTIVFMAAVAALNGEHVRTGGWRTYVFNAGLGVMAAILWVFIYRGRQGNR